MTPEGPFTYFNISLQGYLYTGETGGVYQFTFYQLYNNDDLTFFYFGNHASSPTINNVDQITKYSEDTTNNTYTTDILKPNTYYPILIYYGQSFGGAFLTVGVKGRNDTEYDYTSKYLVTEKPSDDDNVNIEKSPLLKMKNKGQIHLYTHEKIINTFVSRYLF